MKTLKKLKKMHKYVLSFITKTIKNYKQMKKQIATLLICAICINSAIFTQSCNVTRKITTESSYWQKGDTTCTIVTKTTETYDATKKQ